MNEISNLIKRQQYFEELKNQEANVLKSIKLLEEGYGGDDFSFSLNKFNLDSETQKRLSKEIRDLIRPYFINLYNEEHKKLQTRISKVLEEQEEEFNKVHPDLAVDFEKEYNDKVEWQKHCEWEREHDYH